MPSAQHHEEGRSNSQQVQPTPIKLLLTMDEAARALGLGRALLYTLVMKKQIASVKIGRARRVPVSALETFISQQLQSEEP